MNGSPAWRDRWGGRPAPGSVQQMRKHFREPRKSPWEPVPAEADVACG